MVLQLKTEILIQGSINHYTASIENNVKTIDEESKKLNYAYLTDITNKFDSDMELIQTSLRALSKVIDKQSTQYIETSLIKYDAEIKDACKKFVSKIETKKDKLKIFASKFDDLLIAIVTLGKTDVSKFVQMSMDKRSEKVANLVHEEHKWFDISVRLRVNLDFFNEARESLFYQSRRKYEYYEEVRDVRRFLEYLRPIVAEETYRTAVEKIRSVCVSNADLETFIKGNLKKAHERHWDYLMDSFEQDLREEMKNIL